MSRKKLTVKQRAFLEFLKAHVHETKVWPTYREIIDHFGYRSPNSVTQNLKALHRKKHLVHSAEKGYQLAPEHAPHPSGIPIQGIITAGTLQEAVEADLGTITLESLFDNLDRLFALRVSGQSMQGDGIEDGDYVLLIDEDIPNGGIGAVLYNDETSLKHVYYDPDGLRLEPANEDYEAIHIHPDVFEEVRILGRYVGHVNQSGIYRHRGR